MKSIVIELQEMSSDENIPITGLIRKALIVASKLNLSDFKEWIEKEINGYEEISEIPEYRNVTGEVKAINPYTRIWIPLLWPNAPEGVYNRKIKQKISEIEYNYKSADGIIVVPFTQEQQQLLIKKFDAPSPPYLIINKAALAGILESVKDIILKWTLKLEKEGIFGKDMIFSEDEKIKARNNQEIKIENFYGILGSTFTGKLSQEINIDVKNNDLESLLKHLKLKGINSEDLEGLKQSIKIDPKPKQKDKLGENVSKWIGKMIEKASSGAWNVGLSIAANILTNAIYSYYGLK
jgi:hypothetical protein